MSFLFGFVIGGLIGLFIPSPLDEVTRKFLSDLWAKITSSISK